MESLLLLFCSAWLKKEDYLALISEVSQLRVRLNDMVGVLQGIPWASTYNILAKQSLCVVCLKKQFNSDY